MYATLGFCILVLPLILAKKEPPSCIDVKAHPNGYLLPSTCGKSHAVSDRVMGGTNAALGEFPWIAQLHYKRKDGVYNLCGGSIISKKYILTAAHCCVGDMNMELQFVRLGDYDNRTDEDCYRGHCAPPHVDVQVDKIISHYDYDKKKMTNDICLLRLNRPIIFTDYKSPICLPTECKLQLSEYNDAKMMVSGWGALDEVRGRPRDILQKLQVSVVPKKVCQKKWTDFILTLPQNIICAGTSVGEDVCGGDSGGPLMYKAPKGMYHLSGLVSFGLPCDQSFKEVLPGIYTKVSSFLKWILDNIEP